MVFELPYKYADKAVTSRGGMRLMKSFINKTRIEQKMASLGLPEPGSNRGYSSYNILESFCTSVWL